MAHNAGLSKCFLYELVNILFLTAELRERYITADVAGQLNKSLGDIVDKLLVCLALCVQTHCLRQSGHSVHLGSGDIGEHIGKYDSVGKAVAQMIYAAYCER